APPAAIACEDELCARVRELLSQRGAQFFSDLALYTGAFPADLVTALWDLVWSGEVTNDTFAPLRSYLRAGEKSRSSSSARRSSRAPIFRSRRVGPPGSEGRWSLLPQIVPGKTAPTETARRTALSHQLLERYGVL